MSFIDLSGLGAVVGVGLLLGAGLPALFAVGVRALAGPRAYDAQGHRPRARLVAAVASFTTIVVAIVVAIAYIAAGGH